MLRQYFLLVLFQVLESISTLSRPIGGFTPGPQVLTSPTSNEIEEYTKSTKVPSWTYTTVDSGSRFPDWQTSNFEFAGRICPNEITFSSFKNFIFYGTLIGSYKVKTEIECATKCFTNPYCESANFMIGPLTCELNSNSKSSDIPSYKYRPGSNFLENIKCPTETTSAFCGRAKVEPRLNSATLQMARISNFENSQLTEARPHSFPWLVTLQRDRLHTCTGVLISDYYVLTSASCFSQSQYPPSYQAILGAHSTTTVDAGQQTVNIENVIIYPGYRPRISRANDLALVKLSMKANINDKIQPICLPQDNRYCINGKACWSSRLHIAQYCLTVGWGRIGGFNNINSLSQLVTPILNSQQCNGFRWYNGQVTSTMICAGNIDALPCAPDLGGPLLCAFNQTWAVLGVSSWGEGCARVRKPSVYTKIEAYINWIKDVTAL